MKTTFENDFLDKIEPYNYTETFTNTSWDLDYHIYDSSSTTPHNHTFIELFLVTKGPIKYMCNDEFFSLPEGSLVFVSPKDVHQFRNNKGDVQEHINLAVTIETAKKVCSLIHPNFFERLICHQRPIICKLSEVDYNWILYPVNQINLMEDTNENHYYMLKTLLFNSLLLLNKYLQSQSLDYPEWLSTLLETVNSPEFISKTVSDLYDLSSYSPPMLIAKFKKYMGVTPVHYLTTLKINYACNLLKYTDCTTLLISEKIGYESLSHFNRTFKKIMNCTPSEYRKSCN